MERLIERQKCLVCGREYPAGLHIMGCLICFPCEKKLLGYTAERPLRPAARRRLLKLYSADCPS